MALEDPPLYEAFAVPEDLAGLTKMLKEGRFPRLIAGREWVKYMGVLSSAIDLRPFRAATPIVLTAQAASISATTLGIGTVRPGLYRITWHARITRAASTSSSLTVTFAWTDGAVAQSAAQTAITGNSTTSFGSSVVPFRVDSASAITYATTYSSSGATTMQYRLDVTIEEVAAETT